MKLILLWGMFLAGASAGAQTSITAPNVSANALFLYRNSNFAKEDTSTVRNGADLQEAELDFYADVDPYSRLMLIMSMHPDYTLNPATNKVEQSWQFEPEEAYAETNRIPSTTVRIGKFKAAFGKHNQLHTHAFPLVDAPVVNSVLLGDEGLNDVGLSVAVLLPVSWFSELTGQYLRGEGENDEFNSPTPSDAVGLGHWKNLWDLSDALTMEAGASYAQGENSLGGQTKLAGADLTFKWRPTAGGKYNSWILGGEYIHRSYEQGPNAADETAGGWDAWGQYQFAERWAVIARYDHLDVDGSLPAINPNALPDITTKKYSAALEFKATEFSSYKVEYDYGDGPISPGGDRIEHKFYLQANFTIGAHPSHGY